MPTDEKLISKCEQKRSAQLVIELDSVRLVTKLNIKIVFIFLDQPMRFVIDLSLLPYCYSRHSGHIFTNWTNFPVTCVRPLHPRA